MMRSPAKLLYIIIAVLYFPIGTILVWRAYRKVRSFERRCLYDKAERKLENDGIMMFGLTALWVVVCILVIN